VPAAVGREFLRVYLYANGNPVMGRDPSGHDSLMEIQIGMVIVGTLNANLKGNQKTSCLDS